MAFSRVKKLFMWISLLALLTLASGAFFLPKILAFAVEKKLHHLGLPEAKIEKINAGYDGIRLENIYLTQDKKNHLPLVDIYFGEGFSIQKIIISEPALNFELSDDQTTLKLGNHIINLKGKDSAAPKTIPLIPARVIEIKNAKLSLSAMQKTVDLRFQGFIHPHQNERKIDIEGDLNFIHDESNLATTIKIQLEDGKTDLHFTLKDGHIKQKELSIKRLSGWLTLSHEDHKPLKIESEINAGSLNLSHILMQNINLTYQLKEGEHHLLSAWKAPNGQGLFSLDSRLQTEEGKFIISGLFDMMIEDMNAFQATLGTYDKIAQGQLASHINFNAVYDGNIPFDQQQPLAAISTLDAKASFHAKDISLHNIAENLSTKMQLSLTRAEGGDLMITIKDDFKISHGKLNSTTLEINANTQNPALFTYKPDGALTLSLPPSTMRIADHFLSLDNATAQGKNLNALDITLNNVMLKKGEMPYVTPFTLKGSLNKGAHFDAALSDDKGLFYATLKANYQRADQKLMLEFDLPPLPLTENIHSLKDIFPISEIYLSNVNGEKFGLNAKLALKDGEITSSTASILLKQMNSVIADQAIKGINAVITFESLFPLSIQNQRLGIDTLNIGLPLTQGITDFSIDGKTQKLSIHKSDWTVAEGTLSLEPFTYPLHETIDAFQITLNAKNLNLAQISDFVDLDGLEASGYVNGIIPIKVNPDKSFVIQNAKLIAADKGHLKYDPLDPPDFLKDQTQTQMVDLKTALKNFEYDVLEMHIDSLPDQTQKLSLKLSGRNPDFYDGYPVNLNLNLEGDLKNVIQSSLQTFSLDSAIQKQIEDYQKNHVPSHSSE
jgi:hypothetical protein